MQEFLQKNLQLVFFDLLSIEGSRFLRKITMISLFMGDFHPFMGERHDLRAMSAGYGRKKLVWADILRYGRKSICLDGNHPLWVNILYGNHHL